MADDEDDIEVEVESEPQLESRDEELCNDEKVRKQCIDIANQVETGFQDQWERANSQMDYWDIYYCQLGAKQFYNGNSKIFAPLVHDAIEARVTRFTNQIFPASGKHIEVTTSDNRPEELMALTEHYIRKARMRTIVKAMLRNGDVEGQYNLYIDWTKNKRHVVKRVRKPLAAQDLEVEDPDVEVDDIEEQEITHEYPGVEVLNDMDVLVLPPTAASVGDALASGGSVSVIRRWSKAKIRRLIREGEIDKEQGQALLKEMAQVSKQGQGPNKKKAAVDAAGIKSSGKGTSALIYEIWSYLKLDEGERLSRIFYGGEERVASAKRNPNWNDKCPVLSAPVEKIEGVFKGKSKVSYVDTYQYGANDFINEAMDSAVFSLMPIVMTDPVKNPRTSSMVLNVAAIWQTNPKDTSFAQFPPLWKDGVVIVQGFKEQIFQTLGVNPAMIPQQASSGGKKPNQAQLATEQQVDILTTADAVTTVEEEILTPLLQWFIALDHQHRKQALTVRQFGMMGLKATMQEIEPVQMDRRFEFRWYGVEQARNAQMMQIQMAGLNMLRGLSPQDTPGYRKNLAPIIQQFVENLWGPRLAPQIFQDVKAEQTLQPDLENVMLESGYHLVVHPLDDDAEHLKQHFAMFQQHGDPHGAIREHLVAHQMQMKQKQQAMMMQAAAQTMQGGMQGMPGGAGPGVAGTPRRGATPGGPRLNGQGPPGMIHRDRLPMGMPRPTR